MTTQCGWCGGWYREPDGRSAHQRTFKHRFWMMIARWMWL
jgi:hypothetical protein